uniref:Globin domain-containing protein n=1 Tax=Chromera velia CCMP2878 TaxID=1169474 RepID=A0A0G4FY23_9ALVE|eukprot:Cvel_19339.t1-p1 / transcript=Cvel_19339.t1 / gene=Cvel_19339 / organism=Chromera_velia_CCMP2878 / gene_product=hypothetical protein / transcript_product=hypothetical protein / location=Cvel_scaffold1660:25591-39037(-) / protein_length=1226 / sequence_SO=supercontig / SO=protein_coding / is_pseudo=false
MTFAADGIDCADVGHQDALFRHSLILGKLTMEKAFLDMLSYISMYGADHKYMSANAPWLGLRHVHYGVQPEYFRYFRQTFLNALEQGLGDLWNDDYETAWCWAFDNAASRLSRQVDQMSRRLQLVNEDWKSITGSLGKDAFSAKVSANLMIKTSALAKGIVNLISYLVDSVNDRVKLRGVVNSLGIPWPEVFEDYQAIPKFDQVTPVVMQTLQEIVGRRWDQTHEDAWGWLWQLAVDENDGRWTEDDGRIFIDSWKTVEECIAKANSDGEEAEEGEGIYGYLDEELDKEKKENAKENEKEQEKKELPGRKNSLTGRRSSLIGQGNSTAGRRGSVVRLQERQSSPDSSEESPGSPKADEKGEKAEDFTPKATVQVKKEETEEESEGQQEAESVSAPKNRKGWMGFLSKTFVGRSFVKRASSSLESLPSDAAESDEDITLRRRRVAERLKKGPKTSRSVRDTIMKSFMQFLLERAPSQKAIWVKSDKCYQTVFFNQIHRILAYWDNPLQLWADDPDLALEHVAFGVTPVDLPMFGTVLLSTLQRLCGKHRWTLPFKLAWTKYWSLAAQGLSEVIAAAGNPLIRALLVRSHRDLRQALKDIPRGERASAACEVTIKGEKRSAIFWMLDSGDPDLAKLLVTDILTLRTNRSRLYFGRDALWNSHNVLLIPKLIRMSSAVLWAMLDGHYWASTVTANGRRKLLFFVEELWGNPLQENNERTDDRRTGGGLPAGSGAVMAGLGEAASKTHAEELLLHASLKDTLLPQIALAGHHELAAHPVVDFITTKKWNMFAWKSELLLQSLTAIMALCFSAGHLWLVGAGSPWIAFASRAGAWGSALVLFVAIGCRCVIQLRGGFTTRKAGSLPLPFGIPFHLSWPLNSLRLVGVILVLAKAAVELSHGHVGQDATEETEGVKRAYNFEVIEVAITGVILWFASVDAVTASRQGRRIAQTVAALASQMSQFIPLVLLLVLAFAHTVTFFARDTNSEEFQHFGDTSVRLLALLCGAWEPEWRYLDLSVHITLLVFVFIACILLLSAVAAVYVAVLPSAFEQADHAVFLSKVAKVVDAEFAMSPSRLNALHRSLPFGEPKCFDSSRLAAPDRALRAYFPLDWQAGRLRPGRLEFYDSEEGPEVAWPSEPSGGETGGGGKNGSGPAELSSEDLLTSALLSLEKQTGNVLQGTTKVTRLMRHIRKSVGKKKGDLSSSGGEISETQSSFFDQSSHMSESLQSYK